jgi:hypothetical protein
MTSASPVGASLLAMVVALKPSLEGKLQIQSQR